MKIVDLVNILLTSQDANNTEEIFIKIDGILYEFETEIIPEQFDGFETAYPASVALTIKK